MSAGSQIDWGSNVPIYDPDGQLHAVSQDPGMIKAALSQPGAQRAIPVLAPTGEHHWIPENQMHDAMSAGGKIDFPTHDIAKWYGLTPSNVLSNAWQNFKGFYTGAKDIAVDLANNPNWVSGTPQQPSTLEKFVERPMEQQVVKAGQEFNQGNTLAGVGHSLASGVPLVGPWAAGLGEQAGSGDVGGAAGGAAGAYAAIKAPAAIGAVANQVLPSRVRAQAKLDRVVNDVGKDMVPNADASAKLINDVDAKLREEGRPGLPEPVRALQGKFVATSSANALGATGAQPVTMPVLYNGLKAINAALYTDKSVPPSIKPDVQAIALQISSDLRAATREMPRGYDRMWEQGLDEYHQAMTGQRLSSVLGPIIGGAVGFGLGRDIGRAIDAPFAGELATGYLGRMVGKPIAGALWRGIVDRPMPPLPPEPPQGAAFRVGQGVGKVRNFMTGGAPPAPPAATAPPAPPAATAAPMPPPAPPAATGNMPTAASRAASNAAFARNFPPENVPEHWGIDTTPAPKPIDTDTFARAWEQAKREMPQEPPNSPKVLARRDELAGGRPKGDIGEQARQANPEPTRAQTKGATKPPPVPPKPIARNLPPEAYTRFLLQAKEGEISPGELERRFAKYGQPYEVRPLKRG